MTVLSSLNLILVLVFFQFNRLRNLSYVLLSTGMILNTTEYFTDRSQVSIILLLIFCYVILLSQLKFSRAKKLNKGEFVRIFPLLVMMGIMTTYLINIGPEQFEFPINKKNISIDQLFSWEITFCVICFLAICVQNLRRKNNE